MGNPAIPTYPDASKKVFLVGEDRFTLANVGWSASPDLLIALGLKKAADKLIADSVVGSSVDLDIYIYPSCFLYRQYIELSLKSIITESRRITGGNREKAEQKHDLMELWRLVRRAIPLLALNIEKSKLEGAESYIKEFAQFDPNSQKTRYARSKDGALHFPEYRQYDMKNLLLRMGELENFFGALQAFLEDQRIG